MYYQNPNKSVLKKLEYNPDGSMKYTPEWNMKNQVPGFIGYQNVPIMGSGIEGIIKDNSQEIKTGDAAFLEKEKNNIYNKNFNPFLALNVLNFGLNSLAQNKKLITEKEYEERNAAMSQQPEMVSYTKRALRGDNQMFAKEGGEFKENQEYDIDEKEIERLKKLGYEFEELG